MKTREWIASNYLDKDGECGIVDSRNRIVLPTSAKVKRKWCEIIAEYHNKELERLRGCIEKLLK